MLRINLDRFFHIAQQLSVGVDDLHRPTAEHVRRTYQHRITKRLGCAYRFVHCRHRAAFRLGDMKAGQQRFEPLAVFRFVDALQTCAENLHAGCAKRSREIDRRLPAELNDNADRLLLLDDVHDVLEEERLEIQAVRSIEVCRYGLRVIVDDNRFIARFLDRPDRMYGGVVELDALADTDRAGAEHNYLLLV
ncbi:hypothetical protein D3C71_1566180 [compost metagenome]